MGKKVVTLELDDKEIAKVASLYPDERVNDDNPYASAHYKTEGCSIIVYNKVRNGKRKVVFQGENAEYEASIFGYVKEKEALKPLKREKDRSSIGSDEVGTGDFFGPVYVVASYLPSSKIEELSFLGVTDSKAMDDDKIRALGPRLCEDYDHEATSLSVKKYNEVIAKGYNLNAIKAKMHNHVLLKLSSRHPESTIYQDQFAAPATYFSYLMDSKEEVIRDITFATKGESEFPCVALASVIARYLFLEYMDALSEKYGIRFPFGAGANVDSFAKRLIRKIGREEFDALAKKHFANYGKLFP